MLRRRRSAAILAALALAAGLAGCGAPGGDDDAPGSAAGAGAGAGLGTLSGVVVNTAIFPLADVGLQLEPGGHGATSDSQGAFAFDGLGAGEYTLHAAAAGYVGQTLQVATGEGLVRIVLEPDTTALAYVEAFVFDGFVTSSVNVAGARSSNSDAPNYTFEERVPDFLQVEMVWESNQALGSDMDLTLIANDGGTVVPSVGQAEGPSPLMVSLDAAAIQAAGFGPEVYLDLAIFVGQGEGAADRGAGVALEQPFRLFVHLFHGYAPPPGWTFVAEGSPPPPP